MEEAGHYQVGHRLPAGKLITRVVSGGQTGVDRAALDAALELGIDCGGWIPAGRLAEDGRVPDRYTGLVETTSADYAERTRLNIRDSDAILVLTYGKPSGGTALTVELSGRLNRPRLVIDLEHMENAEAEAAILAWLRDTRPDVLNVAGPRLSEAPQIEASATQLLKTVLARS
jgi:hypothetical protein